MSAQHKKNRVNGSHQFDVNGRRPGIMPNGTDRMRRTTDQESLTMSSTATASVSDSPALDVFSPFGSADRRERTRIGSLPAISATPYGVEGLPQPSSLRDPQISMFWAFAKSTADFLGSLFLLTLLSPFLAVIYVLVARSGGKVIFGHRRIGRGGRWFTCYKFRTMIPDADVVLARVLAENPAMREEWDRDEKLRNDPRITRIGEFLRKTSLDELPQLFNVLRGDMSLVGPRPVADTGIARYGKALRWYLAVRPGMTGLWQVSGRNDIEFRRRVVLDIYYVRTQSFLLDLQILFRTVSVVLGGKGY